MALALQTDSTENENAGQKRTRANEMAVSPQLLQAPDSQVVSFLQILPHFCNRSISSLLSSSKNCHSVSSIRTGLAVKATTPTGGDFILAELYDLGGYGYQRMLHDRESISYKIELYMRDEGPPLGCPKKAICTESLLTRALPPNPRPTHAL